MDLESELLRLLNETRGSLLEDVELFHTLQTSKATSIAVQKSLEISESTEAEIDQAREVRMKLTRGKYITMKNFVKIYPQNTGTIG